MNKLEKKVWLKKYLDTKLNEIAKDQNYFSNSEKYFAKALNKLYHMKRTEANYYLKKYISTVKKKIDEPDINKIEKYIRKEHRLRQLNKKGKK